jgi:hypothetical protein
VLVLLMVLDAVCASRAIGRKGRDGGVDEKGGRGGAAVRGRYGCVGSS